MARPRGLPKTGGRKAGTPNRATGAVRAFAQEYTEAAVLVLAAILEDKTAPHMARIRAAEALLDRGHGRPTQQIETKTDPVGQLTDAELTLLDVGLQDIAKSLQELR